MKGDWGEGLAEGAAFFSSLRWIVYEFGVTTAFEGVSFEIVESAAVVGGDLKKVFEYFQWNFANFELTLEIFLNSKILKNNLTKYISR